MTDSQHSRPRLIDVDQSKGLAILLVVIGHVHPSIAWLGWAGFNWAAETIYHFHMAFFMFLSGVVTWYTYRPIKSWKDYKRYVSRRFFRFFPAYILFALAVSLAKTLLAPYFHVDRTPKSLWWDWLYFLVDPLNSSATSLWYVYVLIAYAVIMPPLAGLVREKLQWLLPAAVIVYFLPLPSWFLLNMIAKHAVFFLLGGVVAASYAEWGRLVDRIWWLMATIFSLLCATWIFLPVPDLLMKFSIGLLSIPALLGLIRRFGLEAKCWSLLGRYTFAIYLMNMLAMGGVQVVAIQLGLWHAPAGILWLPISIACGVLVPILVKRYLFARFPWLNRITT